MIWVEESAYNLFILRFFDKTKNEWEHRANFEKVAGKYDMVFVDYSIEDKVGRQFCSQSIAFMFHSSLVILKHIFSFHQEKDKDVIDSSIQQKQCQLNSKVQSLLELICDIKAMEEYVLEMKFDTKKAPLGECVCICVPNYEMNLAHSLWWSMYSSQ